MQFVRDYISHRASSGNIGFVLACSENKGTGSPEKDQVSEINYTDNLPLSVVSELENAAFEVPANSKSSTQKPNLKRVPSDFLQTRTNKSPIKKRKNIDQQVDIGILKIVKGRKRK